MLKKLAIAVLFAGWGWGLAGCGMNSIVPRNNAPPGGLLLTDRTTERNFNLSVLHGSLALVEVSNSGQIAAEAALIDQTTGAHYSLLMSGGSLTLAPVSNDTLASNRIDLIDAATSKTYALVLVTGALTLAPA